MSEEFERERETMNEQEKREVLEPEVLPKEALAVVADAGLPATAAAQLKEKFLAMFADAEVWVAEAKAIQVTDAAQVELIERARDMRLKLSKIRCNAERTRKSLKEESLRTGRAIDGIANVLKALIEPVEAHLAAQEEFAARQAEERRNALRAARAAALGPFCEGGVWSGTLDLSALEQDDFEVLLAGTEARCKARLDAAKKAEAERAAAERAASAERERLRVENERLRQEGVAREAAAAIERDRIAKERLAESRKAEAEAARLRLQAENERKLREQAEAAARAERAATEARAKAERDRILAEQAAAIAEAGRAAKAPDREKILAFAAAVDGLNARIPALASEKGRAFETALRMQVAKFHQWVCKSAESL